MEDTELYEPDPVACGNCSHYECVCDDDEFWKREAERRKKEEAKPSRTNDWLKSQNCEREFTKAFSHLQSIIHNNALDKGFWDDDDPKYDGLKIALMHSELSEALEAIRLGNPPSDKVPEISNLAEELADTVIRIMDYCHRRELPLAEAILKKHEFNTGRPHKHGKAF